MTDITRVPLIATISEWRRSSEYGAAWEPSKTLVQRSYQQTESDYRMNKPDYFSSQPQSRCFLAGINGFEVAVGGVMVKSIVNSDLF
jgi:hypothetical protein